MKLTRNIKWLGAVVISASMGYGAIAFAQNAAPDQAREHRHGQMAKMGEKMKAELNLTDQQVAQIKQIHEQNKATMQADMKAVRAAEKGSDAQKAAIEKMRADRKAVQAQIKNILTADQKAKFEQIQQQRKDKMGKRAEHWKGQNK